MPAEAIASHAASGDEAANANWDFDTLIDAIESRAFLWFLSPLWHLTGVRTVTDLTRFLDRKYGLIKRYGWRRILDLIDSHLLHACRSVGAIDDRLCIEMEALSFGIACAKKPHGALGRQLMALHARLANNIADNECDDIHSDLRKFLLDAAEAATGQLESSEPSAAIPLYEALLEKKPLTPARLARLAQAYWRADRRDLDAKLLYVKTLANTVRESGAVPDTLSQHHTFALEALRVRPTVASDNHREKLLLNQVAVSESMTWAEPWLWLGLCRLNDRKGAGDMLARAARLAVLPETKAEANFALAVLLSEKGEFNAASDHFNVASEAGIEPLRIAKQMGFALAKAHRWSEAVEQFEHLESAGVAPELESYIQWGRALLMCDDLKSAHKRFMGALEFDGGENLAIRGLASCALLGEDESAASEWLQRATDPLSKAVACAISDPSLSHAEALVTLFVDNSDEIEPPEQLLVLTVLEPILTASFEQTTEEWGDILRLCDEVQRVVETSVTWVVFSRAVQVLAAGDLETASALLADHELPDTSAAHTLEKSIALLNGEAQGDSFLSPAVFDGLDGVINTFPLLSDCHNLLSDSAARLQHRISEAPRLVGPIMDCAPEWMRWLQIRATFLAAPDTFLENIEPLNIACPTVAWEICRIADAALPLGSEEHPAVIAARSSVPGAEDMAVHVAENWCGTAARLFQVELSIEHEIQAIKSDEHAHAARVPKYAELKERLEPQDALTRDWWWGQLDYLSVVSGLAAGESTVPDIPISSWARQKAIVQHAMSAMARNDLHRAAELLDETTLDYASTMYAKALLASRMGATNEAITLLDPLLNGNNQSNYEKAALRLRAALWERSGDDRAREAYEDLLSTAADDSLSRQRYLRLLLSNAYTGDDEAVTQLRQNLRPESQAPLEQSIAALFEVMFGNGAIDPVTETESMAILKCRRRLAEGDVEGALSALGDTASSAGKLIVQAAAILRRMAATRKDNHSGEIRKVASILEQLDQMDLASHLGVVRWQSLLQTCMDILARKTDPDDDLPATIGIFDSARSSESQKALAALIRDQGAIADHYRVLRDELEELPVPGVDVWLRATRYRLQQGDQRSSIEEQLPACVEDLKDDRVRLLMGFSFARAGVECFKAGDIHDAHKLVARSRKCLARLVQNEPLIADEPIHE